MNVKAVPVITETRGTFPERFNKMTEVIGNLRKIWNYPDNSITKIGKNTQESEDVPISLAVICSSAKAIK